MIIWKIWNVLMENRWSSSGKYSQDSLHLPPRTNSRIHERTKVWSRAVQRQEHLHANVQRHCMVRKKGIKGKCKSNAHEVADYARRFLRGHWSFLGPGSEKKWFGTYSDKPGRVWDQSAEDMMLELTETIHPLFRASIAFESGELRSKEGCKKTNHFNGSEKNIELILRTVMSANQLSIYGAVADICAELSKDNMASGKPQAHAAQDLFGNDENSYRTSYCRPSNRWTATGNLLREYELQFERLSDAQKLSKLCSSVGLKTFERDNISSHLIQKDRAEWYIYVENIRVLKFGS